MKNPWFRMYAEFLTDPKVQMLSEQDQRRYIMVLCIRCSNGDVTLHDEEVAFQLRISNEEWSRTKAVLVAKGLVCEANQPTKWASRQYQSDSSAERVSRHRAKKKQACNVTVTSPDTDTDTELTTSDEVVIAGKPPRFDAAKHLRSLGIDEQLAADWLAVRKAKKAAPTKTAIDGVASEATKAGIALDEALRICCRQGWAGFKASWDWEPTKAPVTRAPVNGRQAAISSYAQQAAAARGDVVPLVAIEGESSRVA